MDGRLALRLSWFRRGALTSALLARRCGDPERCRDPRRVDAIAFGDSLDDGDPIALPQPALRVGPIFDHLTWRNPARLHHLAVRREQSANRFVVTPDVGNRLGLTMVVRLHRLVAFDQEPLRRIGQ